MAADAVVLAGGLGTRLRDVTGGRLPKVLVPVLGRPFIDYKLRSLFMLGVRRVVISVGEAADQVVEHVGDGDRFGIAVAYSHDGATLRGTAGAIKHALPMLPAVFWVTYGDTLVEAPLDSIERDFLARPDVNAVMTVLENVDQWEPSNVDLRDGRVVNYTKNSPIGTHRWIDYGLLCFRSQVFESVDIETPTDLRSVIEPLIQRSQLMAAPVQERFWEVGTPTSLQSTEEHFARTSMWERLS